MRSSFTHAAAASTSKHDFSDPLFVMEDNTIPKCCPPSVSDPPTYCTRAAGVLRYNRESDNHSIKLTTIPPTSQSVIEYPVKCEYCGEEANPSLDLSGLKGPETAPLFCCARWKQLCDMLAKRRCLIEWKSDQRTDNPTSLVDRPATEMKELFLKSMETTDNKLTVDLLSGHGEQSELRMYEDSTQAPVDEPFFSKKVISFRLSCVPRKGCWTVEPCKATEKQLEIKEEEEQALVPFCDHKPIQFGMCHHQDGAEFVQKYYSNGTTFLTEFLDGSAQVFYPSGLLALVVVVTEENGRVCIVFDDSDASYQPVRALFQPDGRATCYHSNGNIWLTLNTSGGQCLDEEGARVRRWAWSSPSLTPTALHPVFLSLNKTVGVRVLGSGQVFVSILASGQQAKFNVGACCAQAKCYPDGATAGASVLKEELLLCAARIRIHVAIQGIHQYLSTPSYPRLPKTIQAPYLHVLTERLLKVSAGATMSESDRAFIHRCLQECL